MVSNPTATQQHDDHRGREEPQPPGAWRTVFSRDGGGAKSRHHLASGLPLCHEDAMTLFGGQSAHTLVWMVCDLEALQGHAKAPCIEEGAARIQNTDEEVKTMNARHLLETYRDVVARLQNEAAVPTTDAAGSDFLDIAQAVEHQELVRLSATRLGERARRLQIALTRVADGEYGVCAECGTPIPPKRLLAIPDATTCVACQEQLEGARS